MRIIVPVPPGLRVSPAVYTRPWRSPWPPPPGPVTWPSFVQAVTRRAVAAPRLPVRPSLAQHLTDLAWHAPGLQPGLAAAVVVLAAAIAVRAVAYGQYRRCRPEVLPAAPSREERYSYFRGQWRRTLAVGFALLSAGALYGLWSVFTKNPAWYPFLITLAVMIPWTGYMIVVTLRRPAVSAATHAGRPAGHAAAALVNVFIPVCGEDPAVIANTFAHVARLHWTGQLTVHVLDDSRGDSSAIRDLAARYGFIYQRRPDRPVGRKSGNLNYALTQSLGEFIAVFDADFAPAPEFLQQTIGYFADPAVGIVQTSQFFSVTRRGTANWIARLSGVVQGMFFCWSQPGQQARDAAFCVGTNVLYRRSALDGIGGIPVCPSGGEDVVTSVGLLARGWRTVYVPLNLARGLCPATFPAAVTQQYRWCLTTLGLIFPVRAMEGAHRGFWACRMTAAQRIAYLSGLLYYAQSLLTLIISVAPALIMLWVYPYQVGPGNYLPIAPAMLSMLALPLMLPGWRPEMLRICVVYAAAHLLAITDAVTGRTQGWTPTGARTAGKNRTPARAAVIVRTWVAVTQGLMFWALARDLPVYGMPAYWIPLALAVAQAVVLLPLLLPGYGTTGVRIRIRRRRTDDTKPAPARAAV